jgi:hypothetical protein
MNARVGNNSERRNRIREKTLNNNRERLLNFCIMNDLIILNTMFIHKNIHKITREEPSKKEKSIIDYIIVQREMWKYIRDTRVKRVPEINSDHKLLIVEKVMEVDNRTQSYNNKNRKTPGDEDKEEMIKAYKLKDQQRKFQEKIE